MKLLQRLKDAIRETLLMFADDNEANPFDVDFSFDEVPIGLTENNMNNDDVDHQVGCVKGTDASFIRTRQAFFNGTPNAVAMVEMVTCADFCRDNVDPISGEKSDCIGFNYYNTNSPSCAYFSKYVQVVECIINIIPHFIHSGKKILETFSRSIS
uniref:Apple domain-containing protein n=1 Tax=Ascaris lumbricoides TaxID=6252 RepID=A0A0M3IBY9_ASCLU